MTKYVLLLCAVLYAMGIGVISGMMEWYYVAAILIFIGIVLPFLLVRQKVGWWLSTIFYFFFALGILNTMLASNDGYKLKEFENEKVFVSGNVVDVQFSEPFTFVSLQLNTINYRKADGKLSITIENPKRKYTYGDEISFIGVLETPQSPAFDGDADYRAMYLSRGIQGSSFVSGSGIEYLGRNINPIDINYWGFRIRESMKSTIYKMMPQEQAGLLIAIMLGDKSGVSDKLIQEGQAAGISHTLATSGMNVSITLIAFTFLISKVSRNYRVSAGIGILILIMLFFVMGYTPSISRAILMSLLMLSACFFNRKGEVYTALGFSALVILLFYPFALFDVGFILSFASALGIMAIGNRAQIKYQFLRQNIVNLLAVTISALIGTSLFTAYFFGSVTLFGALSNLAIVPLVGWLMPMGYVAALLGWIYLPIGRVLAYSLYVLLLGFEKIAALGAALPLASIHVARPSPGLVIIYFGLCYLLFSFVSIGGKKHA